MCEGRKQIWVFDPLLSDQRQDIVTKRSNSVCYGGNFSCLGPGMLKSFIKKPKNGCLVRQTYNLYVSVHANFSEMSELMGL